MTDDDLRRAGFASNALARTSDAGVAATFAAASEALARVSKAAAVEVPLRLAVTTGKRAMARLPEQVPGVLKPREHAFTFYPADEAIAPFDVPKDVGRHFPQGVVLVARSTKKSVDFAWADGTAVNAPVYRLAGEAAKVPQGRFVGVVDFVDGEPFVRELVSPPRFARLPDDTPDGSRWREGAIVEVDVLTADAQGRRAAVVCAELAPAHSPRARTWLVAGDAGVSGLFSEPCRAEAMALAADQATSLACRSLVDLTDQPFFAIDNPGSKDIDQAMHLQKRADGGYVVSYALADASYYIKPGTSLFEEAMTRGASYYLPGLSLPMLPAELSEGAISLNAHENHRALVLRLHLDASGAVEGPPEVIRAKIRSQAQLTYGGVSRLLSEGKAIAADEHEKPLPPAVLAQLTLFEEIGTKRVEHARLRGVVDAERREQVIAFDHERFFLKDPGADYASKLNAELSILANVGGAQALTTELAGIWVPGIFKTHDEPAPSTYAALSRQVDVVVRRHGLPEAWRWDDRRESLAAWVERLKTLPTTPRERALSQVLQMSAVRINVASGYEREPGAHAGLKVQGYGRFTAPMREQVGIVSHAVLFAKSALERVVASAGLSASQAQALWAPLLLGATVAPAEIPARRRALAAAAQALLSTTGPEQRAIAKRLAYEALQQAPGLAPEEKALVDDTFDRAMNAGNRSKVRQGQVESSARRLLFDDLFLNDLGGHPEGSPRAPRRAGIITAVTPSKLYVQLQDPDVEVRLGLEDLRRTCPGAKFRLEEEGAALVSDDSRAGPVARLFVGADVFVMATHHDGDRLHFAVVEHR